MSYSNESGLPAICDLKHQLKLHEKWICGEPGGLRFVATRHSFIGKDLSGQNLSGSVLRGSDFKYANLEKCNLSNADISSCIFLDTNLNYCDMSGSDLSYSDLSFSELKSINLTNSNMFKTKFEYTSLIIFYHHKLIAYFTTDDGMLRIGSILLPLDEWSSRLHNMFEKYDLKDEYLNIYNGFIKLCKETKGD